MAAAQRPFSNVENRFSIVGRIRGSGGGKSLVLSSHLDVVPAGDHSAWTHAPFDGHIDSARGILYGRGAVDDKAGVAIVLAVAETLVRSRVRLRGDVLLHFVLEDEVTGNGSLLCLEMAQQALADHRPLPWLPEYPTRAVINSDHHPA